MATPVEQAFAAIAYGARQVPRLAWYLGHGVAMRRLAGRARARGLQAHRPVATERSIPSRRRLYRDLAGLLRRDLENVVEGFYPLPHDHDGSPRTLYHRSKLFFEDLPRVNRRRENGARFEVFTEAARGRRPGYYLQNFHFQSDGWMSRESAERYDTQVEVLFNGTANAMRRMAIPPIMTWLHGRDQRNCRLVDIACGTGRFLDLLKQAAPRLPVVGLDLSEPYAMAADRHLNRWSSTGVLVANAETIPLADQSQDLVTSVYLFHELPPEVRIAVFAEMARVLAPGGRMIIVDSLQHGDIPDYDGLLDLFPGNFHEPYFSTYLKTDFYALATANGLLMVAADPAFVSKVMVFDKPVA